MRNYGDAILEFSADRLKILPFRGDLASGSATVRTEITRDNGTPVPVNYSLRGTPQGWKAWDVTIEGISYVKNYRTDFGAQADKEGIEAVIKRLETQNAVGKPDPALKAAGAAAKP
jgi:phospholipid transport system substrate-binding protein